MERVFPRRRLTCIAAILACTSMIADGGAAIARDNGGLQQFLSEQFGFSSPPPPQVPEWGPPDDVDRPLIVRPHRRRSASRPAKTQVAKGPTGPVSIYEDKTLRRGDAVMTAHGIRIFTGSASLPYRDDDFVAVSDADGLKQNVVKALLAIDRMPRS